MKLLVFSCLLALLVSGALGLGYHQDVGIPEAARIQQKEARQMSARIIGGLPSLSGDNPHLVSYLLILLSLNLILMLSKSSWVRFPGRVKC